MITIGLEQEFFLCNGDQLVVVPQFIPHDECGWLVEARSRPFDSLVEAVYSLQASVHDIKQQLSCTAVLSPEPVMKVSKEVRVEASRKYSKGLTRYQNLYGHIRHRFAGNEAGAGIHITFANILSYMDNKHHQHKAGINFDWPRLFRLLDVEFAQEIKDTKRRPGFYELKHDGKVEYRSLPSNVPYDKLIARVGSTLKAWRKGT